MSGDRELLELAAKAAGYVPSELWFVDGVLCWFGVPAHHWNPLGNDADALRLAVKLRLVIHVWEDGSTVSAAKSLPDGEDPHENSAAWHAESADKSGCEYTAARRAIVQAAAEIAKAMP